MRKPIKVRPPKAVVRNARLAIYLRKKYHINAGTRIGWYRARQLASGKKISLQIIKRIARFNRHRKNSKINKKFKKMPYKDRGYIMWLAWGGNEGIEWAKRIIRGLKR